MLNQNDLFQLMLDETYKILGCASEGISISKGCKKRWKDLAAIWGANEAVFGNVFQEVLYRIQNGKFPPNSMCRKNPEFSRLVEESICDSEEAFCAWKVLPAFKTAFQTVQDGLLGRLYQNYGSRIEAVTRFRYDRLLVMTYYRDPSCAQVDLARAERWEIKKARAAAIIRNRYICYKKAICVLLPEAEEWPEQAWLRESLVLHRLARAHGIYQKDFRKLDQVLDILMKKLGGQSYCKELFALDDMPASVAACIWPEGMEKALGRQLGFFMQSMKWHVPSRQGQIIANAQCGWAYRTLLLAAAMEPKKLTKTIKNRLFDMSLGLSA